MFPEEAFKLLPLNVALTAVKTIHDLLESLPVFFRVLCLHECVCDVLLIHWSAILYIHESQTSTLCCNLSRRFGFLPNLIFLEHAWKTDMGNVHYD